MRPIVAALAGGALLAACNSIPDSGAPAATPLDGRASPAVAVVRPPATPPTVAPERPTRLAARKPVPVVLQPERPVRAQPAVSAPPRAVAAAPARTAPPTRTVAQAPAPTPPRPTAPSSDVAAETRAALARTAPPRTPPAATPVPAAQVAAARAPAPAPASAPQANAIARSASTGGGALSRNNAGISDEQDFAAVSARRGIEADAARLNAARQQYQVVTPVELEGDGRGPNIVSYALQQARPVGERTYRRNPFTSPRKHSERCAGYRTADVAQEEFLAAGGPQRDRLNLDPDGDGNACAWNPATYRKLVQQ